jgi:hypothetical protein
MAHPDWHRSTDLVVRSERPLWLLSCSITCALYQQPMEAPLIGPEPKTDRSALVTKHPCNPSFGVTALVGRMDPSHGFVMTKWPAITSPLEAEVANAQAQGLWTKKPPVRLPEAGGRGPRSSKLRLRVACSSVVRPEDLGGLPTRADESETIPTDSRINVSKLQLTR